MSPRGAPFAATRGRRFPPAPAGAALAAFALAFALPASAQAPGAALAPGQGDFAALQAAAAAGGAVPPAGPLPGPQRRSLPRPASWGGAGPPLQGHAERASFGLAMPWGEESFEAFRAAYLGEGGKAWLDAVMVRARPFMPYIRDRIRLYGLPEELAFLPVVESEFSPRAVSKSGASGLWQFMRNSIAGYGMRIDDWVDERRDFMKSTDGALRKLADNYAVLGDWELAIAAYNAGLGAVSRARSRARADAEREGTVAEPGFWELRRRGLLSSETAAYLPKFLAVASILRYPGRNGLAGDWESAPGWETLAPGRSVDLGILAGRAGIGEEALRAANPELRLGVTPPAEGYLLKVPAEGAAAVRAVLMDPSTPLVKYHLHTVRSGDTLSALSRSFGTPVAAIVQANPGLKPDLLRLGQLLVVPALGEAPPPAEAATPVGESLDFSGSYTVARGDTLWAISLRYEVQPELLAERNGLTLASVIREGMALRVPILR